MSLSLLWYPSYDEFDLDLLTAEADVILTECEQKKSNPDFDDVLHLIVESDTPYIYEIVGDDARYECSDGLHLLLWEDYLSATSGLHIIGKKTGLPDWAKPYASQLDGRVYKWHDGG